MTTDEKLERLRIIVHELADEEPEVATCCETITLMVTEQAEEEGISGIEAVLWGTCELRGIPPEDWTLEEGAHCWVLVDGRVFDPKEEAFKHGRSWPFKRDIILPFPWYRNYQST